MNLKYEHLLGRKFIHGKQDCYEAVRDFYRDNYGIELTPYARPDGWWEQGLDLYNQHYANEGFRAIDCHPRDYRPGDLFLYAIRSKVANHAAVNLGDGYIFHHFYGRFSTRELAVGLWAPSNAVAVLRHKDVPWERPVPKILDVKELQAQVYRA